MTPVTCQHVAKSSAPAPAEVVRLWDGRDHCLDCVEAACPGLAEFARGRDCLEDSIPDDRAGGLFEWWKYVGLFFGVLALAGVGFLGVLDLAGAMTLLGVMGLVLAASMLLSLPSVFKARRVLPTVRVRKGVVEVFRPFHRGAASPLATYPLAEARWHVGRLREDSECRGRGGAIVPNQRALILRSPRKWKGMTPPSEFTAIGSSPEMIRLWRGFLLLAGVPEGR